MLDAHNVVAARDVVKATEVLDAHARRLSPDAAAAAPGEACGAAAAAECIDCARRVRDFVNTILAR
jgi:hypothetical protein